MENQLKGLSVDQLKAKIYDSLVVVENHNQFIKLLNQELASRVNNEASQKTASQVQAEAVVNQIIQEDENNNQDKESN
jgi:hypothetical protein